MKKVIDEYNIARVMLIFMVLFGHIVIHCSWSPVYGGIRYDEILINAGYSITKVHLIAVRISHLIYSFHTAAFLA